MGCVFCLYSQHYFIVIKIDDDMKTGKRRMIFTDFSKSKQNTYKIIYWMLMFNYVIYIYMR